MFMVDKEATGRDRIKKMPLCEGGRSILVEERERERERERDRTFNDRQITSYRTKIIDDHRVQSLDQLHWSVLDHASCTPINVM